MKKTTAAWCSYANVAAAPIFRRVWRPAPISGLPSAWKKSPVAQPQTQSLFSQTGHAGNRVGRGSAKDPAGTRPRTPRSYAPEFRQQYRWRVLEFWQFTKGTCEELTDVEGCSNHASTKSSEMIFK